MSSNFHVEVQKSFHDVIFTNMAETTSEPSRTLALKIVTVRDA